MTAKMTFTILGSGAGPGAPSFFCNCQGCLEAQDNPALARTRSGALVSTGRNLILIDTPPDLRVQLIREKIASLDMIFLTHWHYDHFGGIGELEYYVKLKRKEALPLYLPPSAVEQFQQAFPDLEEVFEVIPWEFGKPYHIDQLSITPLAANHGIETAGFMIQSRDKKLAYFPDTAGLPAETMQKVENADWLICDATFHGDNWFPMSHMSVEEAIELGRLVKAQYTVLTHLSVHYSQPITVKELQELASRHSGVMIAYDGMTLPL